jgi:hypothetical protein
MNAVPKQSRWLGCDCSCVSLDSIFGNTSLAASSIPTIFLLSIRGLVFYHREMHLSRNCVCQILLIIALSVATAAMGSTPGSSVLKDQHEKDMLTFTNGDQLSGRLIRADSSTVVFNSAMLGEVAVPWNKIERLETSKPFVVVSRDNKKRDGVLQINRQIIDVGDSTGHDSINLSDATFIIDPVTYQEKIAAEPHAWRAWTGNIKLGLNIVQATQSQRNYSGAITVTRVTPLLNWMAPRERTTLSFQGNYGKLTQPGVATARTEIFHATAEQDEYLSPRLFAYGSAVYDHNLAQSLSLQQAYGGGLGWKLIQDPAAQLEFKSDIHYTLQQFDSPSIQNNLIASSFSLLSMRKLPRSLIWTAGTSVTPAYNRTNAFQMSGTSGLTVPVYKLLSVELNVIDNFLNNPQPGFQRNSFQFSSGFQVAFN